MPGLDMQNYATNPYYARSIASIMPGQTWRDTGHKALCPVSVLQRGRRSMMESLSITKGDGTREQEMTKDDFKGLVELKLAAAFLDGLNR